MVHAEGDKAGRDNKLDNENTVNLFDETKLDRVCLVFKKLVIRGVYLRTREHRLIGIRLLFLYGFINGTFAFKFS